MRVKVWGTPACRKRGRWPWGSTGLYISGWCRANWITSSGKSLVELKVPKVLLGHMPGRGYGTRAWYGTHW